MKNKGLLLFGVLALALARCGKDSIKEVAGRDADNVEGVSSDRTVTVVYSPTGTATVAGCGSGQSYSVSATGGGVTIVNSGSEEVTYILSGATSDGFFKIYSPARSIVKLDGVSITNSNGAALNIQGPESKPSDGETAYIVVSGTNTLADGGSYSSTPDEEDEKGAVFGEGSLVFSGDGSLLVSATGKSGIVSDDYVKMLGGTVVVSCTSSVKVSGSDTTKVAGIKGKDGVVVGGGSLTVACSGTGCKGISSDGTGTFSGGTVEVTVTGSNYGSTSGGGGMGPGRGSGSSDGVKAKGMKFDGDLAFSGSTVVVKCSSHEGIESKGEISIDGGEVYSYASDDAINSASTMTISGGYVYAQSTGNDGLDANGNLYIKGGVVYAIGSSSPEVAIDANTEDGYKLYVQGGTIIAIGGLESGAQLSQGCYSASSWSGGTWYALTVGSAVYAFKSPSSGGSGLVVSGASTPTLKSGVSPSGGTSRLEGLVLVDASVNGGTAVSLSSYSGSGGPGGRR